MGLTAASWFLEERGIDSATLDIFGVNIDNDGTIHYPYPGGAEKVRSNPWQGRSFKYTAGRKPELFGANVSQIGYQTGDIPIFLVEGETDCMRLWQEFAGKAFVVGLSGVNGWRREFADMLGHYPKVYVILDNDADYNVRARVDAVWKEIRRDLGGKAKRIHLPPNVKDVCEFFQTGHDLEHLELLTKKLTQSKYTPVDFNASPPPVRWLVEGLIAMGDVTLLVGKGGLGKSWLSLGLAVSTLRGASEFLGMPLREHGRVLVVDEENPLDIVYSRAKKLGLQPAQHAGQLRYLWNQGIRLDTNPDDLLEEALEFQPSLIILDSLTRVHTMEEKDAGNMARLFNDAIRPLARETGAAVVLIHHHDKGALGPRGSTDIENSADSVIQIYEDSQPGCFELKLTKSRRRLGGDSMRVRIADREDGGVELLASPKTYSF